MASRKPITFEQFLTHMVLVPGPDRALAPLVLHRPQREFARAVDAIDPATGLRRYRSFLLSMIKKAGKSTTAAGLAVWGLTCDRLGGEDREVILVSSDLAQSKDIVFTQAVRMVERHPWLSQRCKIGATEITFRETVTDPKTGGRYVQTHVLRAVPQDVRGLHGVSPSILIVDEAHVLDQYDLLESLAPPPTRPSPIVCFSSYAGLRAQARPGNPLFDVWHRQDDPQLHKTILAGPDAWREVPWITQAWVDQMRRQFQTCPSKFLRLVYNEWAASEHSLITTEELAAAVEERPEPTRGVPGVSYVMGLDLGITHDWTALVMGHVEGSDGKFLVDIVRAWRGTPDEPVSLEAVEDEVVKLAARFNVRRVVVDAWNAAMPVERLRKRNVRGVITVTVEQARLDRLVTILKDAFARRLISIPAREMDLREQLEWLETQEAGAKNRRRDRIKFLPGGDTGAAAHDDLVIAMALALEQEQGRVGKMTMAPMRGCYNEALRGECFLLRPAGGSVTPGNAPGCAECPGRRSVWELFDAYCARHPEGYTGGVVAFYHDCVTPDAVANRFLVNRHIDI